MLGCRIIVQQVSNFYAKKVLNMSNGYSCTILYVFNVTELQPSNSYGFKVSDFYITCLTTLCIHQQKALKIRFTVRITKQSSESKDRKVRFFNITQNGTYLEIREETEWHPYYSRDQFHGPHNRMTSQWETPLQSTTIINCPLPARLPCQQPP